MVYEFQSGTPNSFVRILMNDMSKTADVPLSESKTPNVEWIQKQQKIRLKSNRILNHRSRRMYWVEYECRRYCIDLTALVQCDSMRITIFTVLAFLHPCYKLFEKVNFINKSRVETYILWSDYKYAKSYSLFERLVCELT